MPVSFARAADSGKQGPGRVACGGGSASVPAGAYREGECGVGAILPAASDDWLLQGGATSRKGAQPECYSGAPGPSKSPASECTILRFAFPLRAQS